MTETIFKLPGQRKPEGLLQAVCRLRVVECVLAKGHVLSWSACNAAFYIGPPSRPKSDPKLRSGSMPHVLYSKASSGLRVNSCSPLVPLVDVLFGHSTTRVCDMHPKCKTHRTRRACAKFGARHCARGR